MIVSMKKALILCLAEHRGAAVEALRELGVLHVTPMHQPAGVDLERARDRLEEAVRARAILETVEDVRKEDWSGETAEIVRPGLEKGNASARKVVERVLDLHDRIEMSRENMERVRRELHHVEPFGDFDPERIGQIAEGGIEVRLYYGPASAQPDVPDNVSFVECQRSSEGLWFALAGRAGDLDRFEPYECHPVALPSKSTGDMRDEIASEDATIAYLTSELGAVRAAARNLVVREALRASEATRFLEVRDGMGSTEEVAYVEGYCPAVRTDDLRAAAKEHGWGLVLRDPEEDEQPPTLIRYPAWVRPIRAVFEFLQITPAYREADISMVFLFFFSVFFGMLIGDAGYGLLFLALTGFANIRFRKAPGYVFTLFYILSGCTIAWGVLTGNYFGITDLPAPLSGLTIPWLDDNQHVMELCFFIGAVHLTIAHLWNVVVLAPSLRALEQLGWACLVWTMLFTARTMVLQKVFPVWGFGLLVVGIVLVALFMTPVARLKKDWILHAMLPLNVISCFVDLVSYVRLFAVGMASLSVAQSFNDMALQAGFGSVFSGLLAVFIIVFGHLLNIVLCALAILVHGVRLNTLEFSMHKQMTWSGHPYEPFRRADAASAGVSAAGD